MTDKLLGELSIIDGYAILERRALLDHTDTEEGETMTQTKIDKAHPAVKDFLRHVAQQPAYRDATASCGEAEAYYELNLDVVDELVEYLKSLG